MTDLPRRLLHLEGLAVAAGALVLYFDAGYGWLLLVVLALAPDLAMLGYLAGPRVGALSYDLVHTYVGPVALAVVGVVGDADTATQVALIWATHIGVDRLLGYGLKVSVRVQGHAPAARLTRLQNSRWTASTLLPSGSSTNAA